jgi:hypothetical protein
MVTIGSKMTKIKIDNEALSAMLSARREYRLALAILAKKYLRANSNGVKLAIALAHATDALEELRNAFWVLTEIVYPETADIENLALEELNDGYYIVPEGQQDRQ